MLIKIGILNLQGCKDRIKKLLSKNYQHSYQSTNRYNIQQLNYNLLPTYDEALQDIPNNNLQYDDLPPAYDNPIIQTVVLYPIITPYPDRPWISSYQETEDSTPIIIYDNQYIYNNETTSRGFYRQEVVGMQSSSLLPVDLHSYRRCYRY